MCASYNECSEGKTRVRDGETKGHSTLGAVVKEDLKSEKLACGDSVLGKNQLCKSPRVAKNLAWKREPGRTLGIHSHPLRMATN